MHLYAKIIPVFMVLFLVGGLSACTTVRIAEFKEVLDHPEDATPAPIKFTSLRTQLPLGREIGTVRGGCYLSFQKAGQNVLRGAIAQSFIDDMFAEALSVQGYDVVSRLTADFMEEYEDDLLRSEYKISAKIIDADIDTCLDGNTVILKDFFVGSAGYKGKLFLKIQWAVFDNLRKTVVYKTQTEGYTHRKHFNQDGLKLMVNEAFSMAAHNLGADPALHDLIFYGTKPPQNWRTKKKPESRPRAFDPQEAVLINNLPLSTTSLPEHIKDTRKAAVVVQAGAGHGSGYFITDQGHIITNAHVVGNALRVRVVTAGRADKLIAEVLRVDTVRDVALLKLESMPENMNIITLPIKTQWPRVSEDIYALGAPRSTRLMDTVTKGIVSAHRRFYKVHGHSLSFIQGDVSIHGGNSGGPLLDAQGNIVGMSVSGFGMDTEKLNAALNLFIPIEDALKHLDIDLIEPNDP